MIAMDLLADNLIFKIILYGILLLCLIPVFKILLGLGYLLIRFFMRFDKDILKHYFTHTERVADKTKQAHGSAIKKTINQGVMKYHEDSRKCKRLTHWFPLLIFLRSYYPSVLTNISDKQELKEFVISYMQKHQYPLDCIEFLDKELFKLRIRMIVVVMEEIQGKEPLGLFHEEFRILLKRFKKNGWLYSFFYHEGGADCTLEIFQPGHVPDRSFFDS
jgi:hypothetical protein